MMTANLTMTIQEGIDMMTEDLIIQIGTIYLFMLLNIHTHTHKKSIEATYNI